MNELSLIKIYKRNSQTTITDEGKMRKLFCYLFASMILISCTDQESIIEVERNKLMAEIYISPHTPNVSMEFSGSIIGESFFDIIYVKINDQEVNYETYQDIGYSRRSALTFFWTPFNNYLPFSKSGKIEIATSIGKLYGFYKIPDTLSYVRYNFEIGDTLRNGDKLEIDIDNDADYYVLSYLIENRNIGDSNYFSIPGIIVSKDKHITIDQNILNRSGHIWITDIQSVIGPDISAYSGGNMSGDGVGYLYGQVSQNIANKFYIKLE